MKRALLVLALAGCGENAAIDPTYTAQSGARLTLQMYRFDDGTEQPEPGSFYDTEVHARCTAQTWIDGETRCVPIAEDAVYSDADCTTFVGRAQTMPKPTHFINYEFKDTAFLPAHVLRAGAATDPITEYFQIVDGDCEGPYPTPPDLSYFAIAGEYEGAELVVLHDDEVGDGRLALGVHFGDDGVRVPFGYRDRDLDLPCAPELLPDGSARCAPIGIVEAAYFLDPDCTVPAFVATAPTQPPAIVRAADAAGCATFHRLGAAVTGPVYALAGGTCHGAPLVPIQQAFALSPPIDTLALARTPEDAGRRLQRLRLSDGALDFFDDRLHDTATRVDCARAQVGDEVRCLPVDLAGGTTLYTAGCAAPVPVAIQPAHACTTAAFAQLVTPDATELRAIGAPVTDPLYQGFPGQCAPFTPDAGTTVRALGPPLDPTAFEGAIFYGAR